MHEQPSVAPSSKARRRGKVGEGPPKPAPGRNAARRMGNELRNAPQLQRPHLFLRSGGGNAHRPHRAPPQ
eukprot:4924853-Alexandrium_andersonii.AAC.1